MTVWYLLYIFRHCKSKVFIFNLKSNFVTTFVLQILNLLIGLLQPGTSLRSGGKRRKKIGEGEKNWRSKPAEWWSEERKTTTLFFFAVTPVFCLPPPPLRCVARPGSILGLLKFSQDFLFLWLGDFLQVKCLLDLVNHQSDSFQVTSMIYRVIHMIHHQRIEYLPGRWVVTYRSWPARVRLCLFFWQKKLAGCLIKRSANFFVLIPLTTFSSESVRLQIPRGNKFCAKLINSARWKRKRKQLTFRGTSTAGVVKCCVTVKLKKEYVQPLLEKRNTFCRGDVFRSAFPLSTKKPLCPWSYYNVELAHFKITRCFVCLFFVLQDRVLYRSNDESSIKPLMYSSCVSVKTSDHR